MTKPKKTPLSKSIKAAVAATVLPPKKERSASAEKKVRKISSEHVERSFTQAPSKNGMLLVEVTRFRKKMIRVTIRSDFYENQSEAYSEVWSAKDLKWNRVFSTPHQMNTVARVQPHNAQISAFMVEAKHLLDKTIALLEQTGS